MADIRSLASIMQIIKDNGYSPIFDAKVVDYTAHPQEPFWHMQILTGELVTVSFILPASYVIGESSVFHNQSLTAGEVMKKGHIIRLNLSIHLGEEPKVVSMSAVSWKEPIPKASLGQAIAAMGLHGTDAQKQEVKEFIEGKPAENPLHRKRKFSNNMSFAQLLQMQMEAVHEFPLEVRNDLIIDFHWDHLEGGNYFTLKENT